jgi:hypothetical protein
LFQLEPKGIGRDENTLSGPELEAAGFDEIGPGPNLIASLGEIYRKPTSGVGDRTGPGSKRIVEDDRTGHPLSQITQPPQHPYPGDSGVGSDPGVSKFLIGISIQVSKAGKEEEVGSA